MHKWLVPLILSLSCLSAPSGMASEIPFFWGSIPVGAWPPSHSDYCRIDSDPTAAYCTRQYVDACIEQEGEPAQARCLRELLIQYRARLHGSWVKLVAFLPEPARTRLDSTCLRPRDTEGSVVELPSGGRGLNLTWLFECLRINYDGVLTRWARDQDSSRQAAESFRGNVLHLSNHFGRRVNQLEQIYTRLCGAQTSRGWRDSPLNDNVPAEVCRRGIKLTQMSNIASSRTPGASGNLQAYMHSDLIPYGLDVEAVITPGEIAEELERARQSRCRSALETLRAEIPAGSLSASQEAAFVARLDEECGPERQELAEELRVGRCQASLQALRAESRRRSDAGEPPLSPDQRVAMIDGDCTDELERVRQENRTWRRQAERNGVQRRAARNLTRQIDTTEVFAFDNGRTVDQVSCDNPDDLATARRQLYRIGMTRPVMEDVRNRPQILSNLYQSLRISAFLFHCATEDKARRDVNLATLRWISHQATRMTLDAYNQSLRQQGSVGDVVGAAIERGNTEINYFIRMLNRVFGEPEYMDRVAALFRQMAHNMFEVAETTYIRGVDRGPRGRRLRELKRKATAVRDYFHEMSGPFPVAATERHPVLEAPRGEASFLCGVLLLCDDEPNPALVATEYRNYRVGAIKQTLAQVFQPSTGLSTLLQDSSAPPLSQPLCPWIRDLQDHYDAERAAGRFWVDLRGQPVRPTIRRMEVDGMMQTVRSPAILEEGHVGHVGFPPVIADCFNYYGRRRRR